MIEIKCLPVIYRGSRHVTRQNMKDLAGAAEQPGRLDADPRWLLVRRIAESRCFQKSARLREFLLYVSEKSLQGHPEEVSEQLIGVRVFGRETGYNPAEDNLVRVSARSLRTKLKEYFDGEGTAEAWLLDIPKGSYVPEFRARKQLIASPASFEPERIWKWLALGFGSLAAILGGWLVWEKTALRASPATAIGEAFLSNNAAIHLVLTDSAQVQLNNLLGHPMTLDQYLDKGTLAREEASLQSPVEKKMLRALGSRQITSWADVRLVDRLRSSDSELANRWKIRHARHMQVRDFKSDNFLILATPSSNPWAGLFENQLNFQTASGWDPNVQGVQRILNQKPQSGEQSEYVQKGNANGMHSTPVRIAVLPNLSGNGRVLLIAGLSMEGTEAGVEYMSDPKNLFEVRRSLGLESLAEAQSWELLLEASSLQGSSKGIRILSSRVRR